MTALRWRSAVAASLGALLGAATSAAEPDAGASTQELAKAAQNPVATVISVPFQNNVNFGYGPDGDRTQDVLNLQPVVPFLLSPRWAIITRTIVPLVWQPDPGGGTTFGLGNVNSTAFLSPKLGGALQGGAGPVVGLPTATSARVGSQSTWALGPSAVVVLTEGPWVAGVLANNLWSVAGDRSNALTAQYFVNFNFGTTGWFLATSPTITADWEAAPSQRWVVPFGGGGGRLVRLGAVPVNLCVSAYYNAVKPDIGPDWTLRVSATLLLPTSRPSAPRRPGADDRG